MAVLQGRRAFAGGTGRNFIHQAFQVRQFLQGIVAQDDGQQPRPAPQGHVDDGVAIAQHIGLGAKPRVGNAVVAFRLEYITFDSIGLWCGRIVAKMHRLAGIGTYP